MISRVPASAPDPARIVIAASFVAEPIAEVLADWMDTFGLALAPAFVPYGQVFQALVDPQSAFAGNQGGVNVVLLRLEDWCRSSQRGDDDALRVRLRTDADAFLAALERVAARGVAPFVVWLAPLSESVAKDMALHAMLEPVQRRVESALRSIPGIHALDDAQVGRWYPVAQDDAPLADAVGHVPFSRERYAAIASAVARTVVDAVLPPFKVIVVDADDTLWRGACAELGAEGVQVTEPHRALQEWLVHQVDAGMLLCLCSRNEPADVEAVFERNGAMLLGLEHIVKSRINWQRKSENMRSLAAEFRLGLDSFVFMDDNPVECAEVQANCPGVQVLRLPGDGTEVPTWLNHLWGLDRRAQPGGALARTPLYRQDSRREVVRAESADFAAFLASLQLCVKIVAPEDGEWQRVAELSRRTNQFNLAPQSLSAAHFRGLAPDASCMAVHVEDRFGDYGLTGAVTYRVRDRTLRVDAWMLSCRVLGRGVEHRVLATLGDIAALAGCEDVVFDHAPTLRNAPVLAFLESTCDRLPPRAGETCVVFRILVHRARETSAREVMGAPLPQRESTDRTTTRTALLPAGVLDHVARARRDVAQIRAAAGHAETVAVEWTGDDDLLARLVAIARSIGGGAIGAASSDESLVELGMDSLQIVMLLDEAARACCPGLDDAVFDTGLAEFLARPTLRELAATLGRLAKESTREHRS